MSVHMNVGQLIEELKGLDPKTPVVGSYIAQDPRNKAIKFSIVRKVSKLSTSRGDEFIAINLAPRFKSEKLP